MKRQTRNSRRAPLQLEKLEDRVVPSSSPAYDYIRLSNQGTAVPSTTGPSGDGGYTPAEIENAYGINQISFDGITGNGAGETIAIVDAYNDPTIKSDLAAFDKVFDIPAPPSFKVVNQNGGSALPKDNTGWAGEISLDVEWSHAIAPGANIILVEASSQNTNPAGDPVDMMDAVRYAASQNPAVLTQSFGYPEFPGELAVDSTTYSDPNLVYLASSGDNGAPPKYPSVSPNVLAVGGTFMSLNSSGNYGTEAGWGQVKDPFDGSSTGGVSLYEPQPAFQQGVVTQSTQFRTTPDVAYDASPLTGMDVYQTYGNSTKTPWLVVGGTSDASPQWAALLAIADQGRALQGEGPLNNATLEPELYNLPLYNPTPDNPLTNPNTYTHLDFNTIYGGESLGFPEYQATPDSYNLVTGLGSPMANLLIPYLVVGPVVDQLVISAPATVDAGVPFPITVTAENSVNQVVSSYNGTVSFESSDQLAGLPDSYTFSSTDQGSATFTVTLGTTGSQSITAFDYAGNNGTAYLQVVSGNAFSITPLFNSPVTAGQTEDFAIQALGAGGGDFDSYDGTALITSSDPSVQPFDVALTNGYATFSVTLTTAGAQSVTATDTIDSTMTGSVANIIVIPSTADQLGFVQEPTDTVLGTAIYPAVTVAEEDQYGNIITTDSTTQVELALGTNPTGATLNGGGTVTLFDGEATFGDLTVNAIGTGYTLTASSDSGLSGTSTPFNIDPAPVLENFVVPGTNQSDWSLYTQAGNAASKTSVTSVALHPSTGTYYGLSDGGDGNWYYRTDAAGQIGPGDTVTVWVDFTNVTNSRAYFGFGSTTAGTDSVVIAPNTKQLLIQNNAGYDTYTNFTNAAVSATYTVNTWYMVQVAWATNGVVTASLYASNGVTLLKSVTANTGDVEPGDFAFRAINNSTVYFDTVTLTANATDGINLPTNFIVSSGSTKTGTNAPASTAASILGTTLDAVLLLPPTSKAQSTDEPVLSPSTYVMAFDPLGIWSLDQMT